jgi:peptidoglycan/LPS O-acetylase OafA/YrhL
MATVGSVGVDRVLPSGDEAGTAPGDRPFRPDVEGLRAIAVLLVVLFHSGVSFVSGGYVGVDVFFVISGFVITGVLLRERSDTGRTSIFAFYGRRTRRIIPAATLVIIATVIMAYWFLGIGGGAPAATDGRWAAVFLANFHFIATGTNYLASQAPPSPLQNFWSLAVEEQFYVVYPTLFLLIAGMKVLSLRARLAITLSVVVVASYAYSVTDTHTNPVGAYFSPFTRAWELALGALVAVSTPWLLKLPARLAASATWVGLAAVLLAAFVFDSRTAYPGSLVAIPVVGAALIIAGGMQAHATGAESLLHLAPFRWLGQRSYSLYLWHWPILIIAAEYAGKSTLSVKDNLFWVLVALVAAMATYWLIENPIRHAKSLRRIRWASIGLGVGLIALTFVAISAVSDIAGGAPSGAANPTEGINPVTGPLVPLNKVLSAVAASDQIRTLPPDLNPPLSAIQLQQASDIGFPPAASGCIAAIPQSTVPSCVFGDPEGSRTMVLYGDSHAGMWFQALDAIAKRVHWKLVILFKEQCSASMSPRNQPGGFGPWVACNQWHQFAAKRIRQIDPALLVVSQASNYRNPKGGWEKGLRRLLVQVAPPNTKKVVLGSPAISTAGGADCMSRHANDIQACSGPPDPVITGFNNEEQRAAISDGARYVSVIPWFCTKTCSDVIGHYATYIVGDHVTVGYSLFLEGVLAKSLDLPA